MISWPTIALHLNKRSPVVLFTFSERHKKSNNANAAETTKKTDRLLSSKNYNHTIKCENIQTPRSDLIRLIGKEMSPAKAVVELSSFTKTPHPVPLFRALCRSAAFFGAACKHVSVQLLSISDGKLKRKRTRCSLWESEDGLDGFVQQRGDILLLVSVSST